MQGLQAVLHPDVVERPGGEAGGGVGAEDVDVPVLPGAADAIGPHDEVVDLADELRGAALAGVEGVHVGGRPDRAGHRAGETGDRHLLLGGEPGPARLPPGDDAGRPAVPSEPPLQEPAVGDAPGDADGVGERRGQGDGVEHAGVVLGDLQLLDGAAGAAGPDRVPGHAVGLGHVLLGDERHLGRHGGVAGGVERGQGTGDHRVARAQQVELQCGGKDLALGVGHPTAPTEPHHQPTVPARRVPGRTDRHRDGGPVPERVEHGGLHEGAVEDRGLHPNDERHPRARGGDGGGDVGWQALRIGQVDQAASRVDIAVRDPGGRAAVRPRGAEAGGVGRAHERLLAGSGEQWATAVVIGHGDRRPVGAAADHDLGLARGQTVDPADQTGSRPWRTGRAGIRGEGIRDVASGHGDGHAVEGTAGGGVDRDDGVAAGHVRRRARDRGDAERGGRIGRELAGVAPGVPRTRCRARRHDATATATATATPDGRADRRACRRGPGSSRLIGPLATGESFPWRRAWVVTPARGRGAGPGSTVSGAGRAPSAP